MIDLATLVREVRETADWILQLPVKLIAAWQQPSEELHSRRERIRKLKELTELREIGKNLQYLYFWKGDMIAFAQKLDAAPDQVSPEAEEWFKESFDTTAAHLKEMREQIADSSFSNLGTSIEAISTLSRAIVAYEALRDAPKGLLLHSGKVAELCSVLISLEDAGHEFIKRVDERRHLLDHTY